MTTSMLSLFQWWHVNHCQYLGDFLRIYFRNYEAFDSEYQKKWTNIFFGWAVVIDICNKNSTISWTVLFVQWKFTLFYYDTFVIKIV